MGKAPWINVQEEIFEELEELVPTEECGQEKEAGHML